MTTYHHPFEIFYDGDGDDVYDDYAYSLTKSDVSVHLDFQ